MPWHSVAVCLPGLERCTFGASTAFSPTLCSLPRPPTPIGSGQCQIFLWELLTGWLAAPGPMVTYIIYMHIQIAYNYIMHSDCKPTFKATSITVLCRYFIMQIHLMCTDYSNELLAMEESRWCNVCQAPVHLEYPHGGASQICLLPCKLFFCKY